jgi:uncharacterized HAD superfamily protein
MTIIGFDLDGVICDWHKEVETAFKANFNTETRVEFWDKFVKLPEEDIQDIINIRFFYRDARPNLNAVKTLKVLSKYYDIIYVTCRPDNTFNITEYWLKTWDFPFAPVKGCSPVYQVKNKATVLSKIPCSYYIEDRIEIADTIQDLTNIIMIKQPWNINIVHNYPIVNNIKDILKILT